MSKPFRCRLGMHKWTYVDTNIWLMYFIYRCDNCGKGKAQWARP